MHLRRAILDSLALAGLLLLGASAPSAAQTVRGVVFQDTTDAPVPGAQVELLDLQGDRVGRAQSDTLGTFLLRPPRPGTWRVRLTHPFYTAVLTDTLSVEKDEVVRLELRMAVAAVPLAPLVVVARSHDPYDGFHRRAAGAGIGRYLTREQIDERRALSVTNLLREMPGVTVRHVPRAVGTQGDAVVMLRGGVGACLPTIYLDGMRMGQYGEGSLDDFLVPEILEGVEVYPSPAGLPAQFQSFGDCGVIAFWTREAEGRALSWKRLALIAGAVAAVVLLTR